MAEESINKWIEGLEDFRSRSECIRLLVRAGDAAVEPLTNALDSALSEGARWAIIRCLGSIGDRRATPALAPLLKERNMAGEAREALVKIVGKDLGPAPEQWLKQAPAPESRAGRPENEQMRVTGLDESKLLELVFERDAIPFRKTGQGRYSAEIPAENDEKLNIRIHFDEKDHEGEPIVIVYSRCGPAQPKHFEQALRLNIKMPYGALAVTGRDAAAQFVMFNTLLRQDMSAAELKKSALTVARRARQVRKELDLNAD